MASEKSQNEMRRELSVDESKHSLFRDLTETDIFQNFDAPMKHVFLYAMALGVQNGNPVPLRKKRGSIPTRSLSDSELWLINSVAITKENNLEVLFDLNNIQNIAEEYANGGIEDLYNLVMKHSAGDSYRIMDNQASELLKKDFVEKAKQDSNGSKVILKNDVISLVQNGENEYIEFKSSLLWDHNNNCVNKTLGLVIAKSIVCFLNSRKGGTILIGVKDDKTILGLENDFKNSPLKKNNEDGFQLKINELVDKYIGKPSHQFIHVKFEKIEEKTVCVIRIEMSSTPVYLNNEGKNEFYARTGNSCQQLDAKDANEWINTNWRI